MQLGGAFGSDAAFKEEMKMNEMALQTLSANEVDSVGGAIGVGEAIGYIATAAAFAPASPIVIGVASGAIFGLLVARMLA